VKRNVTVDTSILTEIAEYYREIGFTIPEFYPLVGENFNVTRAGVHADGMIKNPEIYNSYDLRVILGCSPKFMVGPYSGTSSVACKVNELLGIEKDNWIGKNHPGIFQILEVVGNQYEEGRVTVFSDQEILKMIKTFLPCFLEKAAAPRALHRQMEESSRLNTSDFGKTFIEK
jgi:isopropylmalate/homocitrate/citramalate synthase